MQIAETPSTLSISACDTRYIACCPLGISSTEIIPSPYRTISNLAVTLLFSKASSELNEYRSMLSAYFSLNTLAILCRYKLSLSTIATLNLITFHHFLCYFCIDHRFTAVYTISFSTTNTAEEGFLLTVRSIFISGIIGCAIVCNVGIFGIAAVCIVGSCVI